MNQQQTTTNRTHEYLAKDLGLCSALYTTRGIRLLRLQKDPAGYSWFVFDNKPLCEETAQLYWFDSLTVSNAKAFNDARKSLMDKLHATY